MNDPTFIEPTTKARALFGAWILIGVIGFILSERIADSANFPEGASLQDMEQQLQSLELSMWILFGISVIFIAALSSHLARMGFNGLASHQFPPMGTLVIRRTKIKTGADAALSSWLAIVIAILVWGQVALLAYGLFSFETAT